MSRRCSQAGRVTMRWEAMGGISWGTRRTASIMVGDAVRKVEYYANTLTKNTDDSGQHVIWICIEAEGDEPRTLEFKIDPNEFDFDIIHDLGDYLIHQKVREWLNSVWLEDES